MDNFYLIAGFKGVGRILKRSFSLVFSECMGFNLRIHFGDILIDKAKIEDSYCN